MLLPLAPAPGPPLLLAAVASPGLLSLLPVAATACLSLPAASGPQILLLEVAASGAQLLARGRGCDEAALLGLRHQRPLGPPCLLLLLPLPQLRLLLQRAPPPRSLWPWRKLVQRDAACQVVRVLQQPHHV